MDPSKISAAEMAQRIDHTLLKPEASKAAFDRLCSEAVQYEFKAVCVNSGRVAYVSEKSAGSAVAVCAVVGFPLGATHSSAKAFEAAKAIEDGASELDMVLNIGALKDGDLKSVEADIRAVRRAAAGRIVLKVIIETCLLTDSEKKTACGIAKSAGADFVKTSTGFSSGGATVKDVALMRRIVGKEMGVKASGGIKDYATAVAMLKAGASRLGVSAGIAIIEGAPTF